MKNKENKIKTKQKQKNTNPISLWITVISSLIAFVLFGISHYCKSTISLSIAIIIFSISGILAGIWLIISTFCDIVKTSINEYKTNNNLFAGALSFFLVSVLIAIFIDGFGSFFAKEIYETYHSIANTFLSAIPGWFALIGVYYTATVQEKRREADFIILNTPYPLIELSSKKDLKNSKEKAVSIKVSNLAENILIPISIGGNSLGYVPVTKTDFREFPNLKSSLFENNEEIFFIYEDINHRRYKTKLHIVDVLNEQPPEDYDYIIIKNEKPVLVKDEETICNEGDLQ